MANKTQENDASVLNFINQVEDEQKRADSFEIMELMESISGAPPKMWGGSIIGFGKYHYKYDSGREGDFMRIGFSPRKQNLSLYIISGFSRYDDIMSRLGKYKTGKSCLYIKRLSDVDRDVLKELCKASLDFMRDRYPEDV
jgi:hypothetical protein